MLSQPFSNAMLSWNYVTGGNPDGGRIRECKSGGGAMRLSQPIQKLLRRDRRHSVALAPLAFIHRARTVIHGQGASFQAPYKSRARRSICHRRVHRSFGTPIRAGSLALSANGRSMRFNLCFRARLWELGFWLSTSMHGRWPVAAAGRFPAAISPAWPRSSPNRMPRSLPSTFSFRARTDIPCGRWRARSRLFPVTIGSPACLLMRPTPMRLLQNLSPGGRPSSAHWRQMAANRSRLT